jgi:hypothetical protein
MAWHVPAELALNGEREDNMPKHGEDPGIASAIMVVAVILIVLAGCIFLLIWNPHWMPKG